MFFDTICASLCILLFGASGLLAQTDQIGEKELANWRRIFDNTLETENLTSIPSDIGLLSSLTKLSVFANQLTSLPTEIGQLQNLTYLDIKNNKLTSLPSQTGLLSALTWLNAVDNKLTSIPSQISYLTALVELYLPKNSLPLLPPQIGQLSSLTILDLSRNLLASLPSQIGNLTSLTRLFLVSNQLSSLPTQIGNLASLRHLFLANNTLTHVPSQIARLSALTTLVLSSNRLSSLPNLTTLDNLATFSINNNQFRNVSFPQLRSGFNPAADGSRCFGQGVFSDGNIDIPETNCFINNTCPPKCCTDNAWPECASTAAPTPASTTATNAAVSERATSTAAQAPESTTSTAAQTPESTIATNATQPSPLPTTATSIVDDTTEGSEDGAQTQPASLSPPTDSDDTGVIVGAAVGGVLALALAIVGLLCFLKRRSNSASAANDHELSSGATERYNKLPGAPAAANASNKQYGQRPVGASGDHYEDLGDIVKIENA